MQNHNEEQLIYVKDLLFSLLYRWKRIVLFGMLFALLLGGLKGVSAYSTLKTSTGGEIPQVAESPERVALENKLETLQAAYNSLSEYQQESVLMQVNPYEFYKVSLSLYVAADRPVKIDSVNLAPDPTGAILNSYAAILTSEEATAFLSETLGVNPEYFGELITVNVYSGTGVMDVFVAYPTKEGAQTILGYMLGQLQDNQAAISQSVHEHQLSIYQKTVSLAEDALLAEAQGLKHQALADLRTSINNTKSELGAFSFVTSDAVSIRSLLRSVILCGAVGFIFGAFVVVACIWIALISGNKVYSARTLSNQTGVKVLGAINTKSRTGLLMRILRKMDNRNLTQTDLQAQLLSANVRNLCAGKNHLLVTGSANCAVFTNALKQAMPGMQISVCGSLLENISAVDALSQCDCVVLVEACNTSRYTDIQHSAAMIADNEKHLLGCVLLNG